MKRRSAYVGCDLYAMERSHFLKTEVKDLSAIKAIDVYINLSKFLVIQVSLQLFVSGWVHLCNKALQNDYRFLPE